MPKTGGLPKISLKLIKIPEGFLACGERGCKLEILYNIYYKTAVRIQKPIICIQSQGIIVVEQDR